MTEVLLRNRDLDSGKPSPDRFGKPLVYGALRLLAWASGSNPTAEAIDGTGCTELNAIGGMTTTVASGLITVPRDGNYLVKLVLGKFSAASASGVITIDVQKNTAAMTVPLVLGVLQPAVAANFMSGACEQLVSLVKGDTIRAVITGSTGGIITIAEGILSVEMKSDATVYTQV